ncbi:MAG: MnhB domain-containing protein [Haloarculaceae archaeon]
MSSDPSGNDADSSQSPYVESPLIMTTVRVITPFVFTFGLFVMFHGADSSGGGFQGGVIVGTVVFMLGIAFGIEATRDWVGSKTLIALISLGVLAFLLAGIGSVVLGGAFLEYDVYGFYKATKYGIEFVELAIGLVVSGTVTGLFFVIASGIQNNVGETQ